MSKKNETPLRALSKKEKKTKAIADGPQKRFLGIVNPINNEKLERIYNTSMLKSYLKGGSEFAFGYKTVTNEFGASVRVKNYLPVVFEDKTLDPAATQKLLSGGFTNRGCQFVRNTPGAKRTSHAEIKDRKFQKEEDAREREVEEFNKEVKKFNKGKKKAEKMELRSFTRKIHRPGSKAELESKLGL